MTLSSGCHGDKLDLDTWWTFTAGSLRYTFLAEKCSIPTSPVDN